VIIRDADEADLDELAKLWYDGWQDGHAEVVPAELKRLRTLQSFRERLSDTLSSVRVAGGVGEPAGFHIVKDDELYQLYVAASARGSGVASDLIADAEAQLLRSGVTVTWLSCAIGNNRAARFYEKCGWHRTGTMINYLETSEGIFELETWRYEKGLGGDYEQTDPGANNNPGDRR
jgi:GNAT superfamily N-acetyltransferase